MSDEIYKSELTEAVETTEAAGAAEAVETIETTVITTAPETIKSAEIVGTADVPEESDVPGTAAAAETADTTEESDHAGKADKKEKSGKKNKQKALKKKVKSLNEELMALQQPLREAGLPVIVLVEGWASAGKGYLINELIRELDPRFYNVATMHVIPEKDCRYPFLSPYVEKIPENGKIMFYDSGWMEDVVKKYVSHEITKKEFKKRIRVVNAFERQLRDGGYLILKLFMDLDKEEQFKRLSRLSEDVNKEWRVTEDDRMQHREYKLYKETYETFMANTGDVVKWHVLDGNTRLDKVKDALKLLVKMINAGLENGKYTGEPFHEDFPLLPMPKLADVDLSPTISDEEYKKQLKDLQKHLSELHNVIYRRKIPVILCYEGWDAAGKGGNIRRVTYPLDPRGFDVMPIASPEPHELSRHYLWRFWTRLPRTGHFCVFDRTWYGRVMVERLEGFCSKKDWKRAYNEINEFESMLTDWGAVVLKFWIHIDSDTQLERFNARQNTPEKQWKITEEDWRNRDKWDQYEEAIDEMLQKTSTENAPWIIIESNDKKYARIKALTVIIEALEKACRNHMKKILD